MKYRDQETGNRGQKISAQWTVDSERWLDGVSGGCMQPSP